jgi:hypothetical protein
LKQPAWLVRQVRGKAEIPIPRRFLMPYLTTLSSHRFKVLFAATCPWRLSDCPLSSRVSPKDIL